MIPISVQLYSLRDANAKDFPAVLTVLAKAGYVGIEFAGFYGHKPSDVASLVADLGLKVSSCHCSIPDAGNIAELVETYSLFGVKHLVGGVGRGDVETSEALAKTIDRFQTGVALASENGMTFSMHNHDWEFRALPDGRMPYDVLLDSIPALSSELDVYWVQVGGSNPAEVVKKYSSRLPLLHIKDGMLEPKSPMCAVGSGVLDMPSIIAASDPKVTEWLVVELDACATDMMTAVKDSYRYLVGHGLAAGNVAV